MNTFDTTIPHNVHFTLRQVFLLSYGVSQNGIFCKEHACGIVIDRPAIWIRYREADYEKVKEAALAVAPNWRALLLKQSDRYSFIKAQD